MIRKSKSRLWKKIIFTTVSCQMVIGMLLSPTVAKAAATSSDVVDALGISAQLPEVKGGDTTNPYTKSADVASSLFTSEELLVAQNSEDGTNIGEIYDFDSSDINSTNYFTGASSQLKGQMPEKAETKYNFSDADKNHDYYIFDAFDLKGSGQKDHVFFLYADYSSFYGNCLTWGFKIINMRTNQVVQNNDNAGRLMTRYNSIEAYQLDAIFGIAVGDYNGDGRDEIAMVQPMDEDITGSSDPIGPYVCLREWNGEFMHIYNAFRVGNESVAGSEEEGGYTDSVGMTGGVSNMTADTIPAIDLETIEQDDETDDLAIAVSYGRGQKTKSLTAKGPYTRVMVLKDAMAKERSYQLKEDMQTFDMTWDYHAYDSTVPAGTKYENMLFGGLASGDIDGDGHNELVIAGYRLKSETASSWALDTDKYLICYLEENGADGYAMGSSGKVAQWVDFYQDRDGDYFDGSKLLIGDVPGANEGFYSNSDTSKDYRKFMNPMTVACFAERGDGYAESIFADGSILELVNQSTSYYGPDSNSTSVKSEGFSVRYTLANYEMMIKGEGEDPIKAAANRYITDVAVGNYDKNTLGMEQLACVYQWQRDGYHNDKYTGEILLVGQTCSGNVASDTIKASSPANGEAIGKLSNHAIYVSREFVSASSSTLRLCALDCDSDGMVAKFQSKKGYFANPNVYTILQTAPYYQELEDLDGNYPQGRETTYSTASGSSQGVSSQVTIGAGLVTGFSQEVSLLGLVKLFEIDFESKLSAKMGYGYEAQSSYSETLEYTNTGATDLVVVGVTPYMRYAYLVYMPESTLPSESDYKAKKSEYDNLDTYLKTETNTTSEEYNRKKVRHQKLDNWLTGVKQDLDQGKHFGDKTTAGYKPMNLDIPEESQTRMLSVRQYDEIAKNYPQLSSIGETVGSTPGVPSSYPSSREGFEGYNTTSGDGSVNGFMVVAPTDGQGVLSQSVEIEETKTNSLLWGTGIENSLTVNQGGAKMGVSLDINYDGGYNWTKMSSVAYTGKVPQLPQNAGEDYGFKFRFGVWTADVVDSSGKDGNKCVVLGYLVKDAKNYPQRPTGLTASQDGEQSVLLHWEVEADGSNQATALKPDGFVVEARQKGDNNEFTPVAQNLNGDARDAVIHKVVPGKTYEYRVKSKKGSNTSLASEIKTFTIPDSTNGTFSFTESPQDFYTRSGGKATYTVAVKKKQETEYNPTYQWQSYASDHVWKNINDATSEKLVTAEGTDGQRYRCRVSLYDGVVTETLYSSVATLHQGKAKTEIILTNPELLDGVKVNDARTVTYLVKDTFDGTAKVTPTGNLRVYDTRQDGSQRYQDLVLSEKSTGVAQAQYTLPTDTAGAYQIRASYQGNQTSLEAVSESNRFVVGEQKQLQAVLPDSVTYGDQIKITGQLLWATGSQSLEGKDGLVVKVDGTVVTDGVYTIKDTQNHSVTLTYSGEENYSASASMKAEKAKLSITAGNLNLRENEMTLAATPSYRVDGLRLTDSIKDSDITMDTSAIPESPSAGATYALGVKLTAVREKELSENYEIAYIPGSVTVTADRSYVTLTLKNKTAIYKEGVMVHVDSAVVGGNGESLVHTEDIIYQYYTDENCSKLTGTEQGAAKRGGAPSKAGTYYVKAILNTTSSYYGVVSNTAVLSIQKGSHSVQVEAAEHGSISVNPDSASAGAWIIITVAPEQNYELDLSRLRASYAEDSEQQLEIQKISDATYMFQMPDTDVNVEAGFTSKSVTGVKFMQTSLDITEGTKAIVLAKALPYGIEHDGIVYSLEDESGAPLDEKIATISEGGVITTGRMEQEYTKIVVRAAVKNQPAYNAILHGTIIKGTALQKIGTEKSSYTLGKGETIEIPIICTPSTATNQQMLYTSSDEEIASVSRNGIVTGRKNGQVTITVTSVEGNFKVQTTVQVKDQDKNLEYATVTGIRAKIYDGKIQKQNMTVSINGKTLSERTDYTVSYTGNINIGTATIILSGKGSYVGTIKKTFQILVQKNGTYTVGSLKYKITSTTGTVSVTGTTKSKSKLTSLSVGNTVSIGGKVFKITAVEKNAFKGFKKLKKVTLGSNITSIGKNAFYDCKKLSKLVVKGTKLKSVGSKAIKNIKKNAFIDVPKKKISAYKKLFKGSTGYKKTMKIK